jgi:hypothetical protein
MNVPTQWNEVTLKQYIEVADLMRVDIDELDRQVKILAVLSGVDEDELGRLSLPNLKKAIRAIQFIYNKPKPKPIKQHIKIGTKKFSVNLDMRSISGGEYMDLTQLIKDKEMVTSNLPSIIAIFLHPVNYFGFRIKDCYVDSVQTLDSRINTAKLIEDKMNMEDVIMLSGFFLNLWSVLIKDTADYSEKELKEVSKKLNKV